MIQAREGEDTKLEVKSEKEKSLLEWSYAYKCDRQKNRMGDRYLVFYEARTV